MGVRKNQKRRRSDEFDSSPHLRYANGLWFGKGDILRVTQMTYGMSHMSLTALRPTPKFRNAAPTRPTEFGSQIWW